MRNLHRYAHSDVEEEKSSAQWAQVLNGLNFEQKLSQSPFPRPKSSRVFIIENLYRNLYGTVGFNRHVWSTIKQPSCDRDIVFRKYT